MPSFFSFFFKPRIEEWDVDAVGNDMIYAMVTMPLPIYRKNYSQIKEA